MNDATSGVPGDGGDSGPNSPAGGLRHRGGRKQADLGPGQQPGQLPARQREDLPAGGSTAARIVDRMQTAAERANQQRKQRERLILSLPDDAGFPEHYPGLWWYLTEQVWDDRRKRTPCSLTVRLISGGWAVTLTDSDLSQSLTVNVLTWAEMLPELEKAISDPDRLWKQYKDPRLNKDRKKVPTDP